MALTTYTTRTTHRCVNSARSNLLVPLLLPALPVFATPHILFWHPFTHPSVFTHAWHSPYARLHWAPRAHRARTQPPPGSRPLHQNHAPCSRHDSALVITARAHPLTTSYHVPSFQAGPSAPALNRTTRTPNSRPLPIRLGPVPGPDSVGPGLILALPHSPHDPQRHGVQRAQ